MPEPTRAELKAEIDALRRENRSLTMQLWEIRHVVVAYRTYHVQETQEDEE